MLTETRLRASRQKYRERNIWRFLVQLMLVIVRRTVRIGMACRRPLLGSNLVRREYAELILPLHSCNGKDRSAQLGT